MADLKLFLALHMGGSPCWPMTIQTSAEDALFQCFGGREHSKISETQQSCRVEEVKVPGYEIVVRLKA